MNSGKYMFWCPVALIRSSTARWMASQMAYPYGRITMVPRAMEGSASSAPFTTSWYQAGKSSSCLGRAMRGRIADTVAGASAAHYGEPRGDPGSRRLPTVRHAPVRRGGRDPALRPQHLGLPPDRRGRQLDPGGVPLQ